MDETFAAPEWFGALTLAERAALLATDGDRTAAPDAERMERARRKADRWRRESDLLDDGLFAERLARDGLTPDRFLWILAAPNSEWQRRAGRQPDWLQLLARTYSQPAEPPLPTAVTEGAGLGVLELLRPLIAEAYARLLAALRRIRDEHPGRRVPFAAETVATDLLQTLLRRLRWAAERVLALELQICSLEGKLSGETSEARFRSFVEGLRQPTAALEILRRYPVLARDACRQAGQWVETGQEMMERFAADRDAIVDLLAPDADPGPVIGAASGLSDRHAGGRSVAILSFASGLRIVYKPKPLALDRRFQDLLAWLNERGAEPPLRCLRVLDRGSHGWMEHVAARPCETADEVERFYARQGAWVALFYALESTDFHHENLIAEGEHPVPIDLETLFQPGLPAATASGPGSLPTAHTVLNSGLLPRRFWSTATEGGLDLSGMGAVGGQRVEMKRITDDGTDRMRWDRHEVRLAAGPNLPTLRGEPLTLGDHAEPVLRGFHSMFRLLARHREELCSPEGPLSQLAGLPIRVLLRGTTVYAHLLHVAHHPDYLQNALDWDRLYDKLWLDAVRYPPLRRAVGLEQEDLRRGDVPFFAGRSTSIDLLPAGGVGGDRVQGYFAAPGHALVRARLLAMDEEDFERQSWLVQAAIEATRALDERRAESDASLPAAPPARPERFLAMACRLGDRLLQLAVEQGELVSWFHLDLRPDGWLLEPLPAGLYSGLAGMALFFAHLGRLAGDERYERMARRALHTVRQRIAGNFGAAVAAGAAGEMGALVHVGAYSGWGGLVYAFTHLGLLWEERGLLDAAEELATAPTGKMSGIESDEALDLIAGSAGAAAALLALHRHRPSPAVLDLAVRAGERLLATALVDERGWGWPSFGGIGGVVPLTGFSHGVAGIAWALAQLASATGDERFRVAARGALRYERSWFSPEHDNWPDLRESAHAAYAVHAAGAGPGLAYAHAWCHGAPGIGLGRLGTLPYLDDPEMLGEIRAAVRSTRAAGFGGNQSLCHGDLGNLDLLREAGRVLGDGELTVEADDLAARILARIESGDLRCGASHRPESPGLMVGLAGIGYGLLRAAYPDRVPSVLLLQTPGVAAEA